MRIEIPRYTERFGSVRINDVQRVLELDSGAKAEVPGKEAIAIRKMEEEEIREIEARMAIVLPIKNEKLKLFETVLSGIPHDCLIIVVSNSQREPVNRFRMERDTLRQFCHFTQSEALIIHQKDPIIAQALEAAKYTEFLDEERLVRDGKCEGMILGILMAMLYQKDYVGFIDTDNYLPGAVWEYAKGFAAGFSFAVSPYAMVRILWRYKAKITESIYFRRWGRVSGIINRHFNHLISARTGFETEIIKTANAGEHAMTIELAKMLNFASGYAVEPQELISIFEQFGGILPPAHKGIIEHGVSIFQIETRNPHIHEERGVEHIDEMLLPGLATIYHSPLADPRTKELILEDLEAVKRLKPGEEFPKPHYYPPLEKAELEGFSQFMQPRLPKYLIL